mmetsp:Transcript_468/g.578  ORF Transcript_468/g.578 Transcript_468/m.578 type:complete len:139 (+) Transcript_468:205-621(+)
MPRNIEVANTIAEAWEAISSHEPSLPYKIKDLWLVKGTELLDMHNCTTSRESIMAKLDAAQERNIFLQSKLDITAQELSALNEANSSLSKQLSDCQNRLDVTQDANDNLNKELEETKAKHTSDIESLVNEANDRLLTV